MSVMAYEVTLKIDGTNSIVTLDDTYPAVRDWVTATEFAIHLVLHDSPDSRVDFMDCAEYEHEEYKKWGYIYEAPSSQTAQCP